MRAFTLVMGTFNLEVEESEKREDGSKSYSAKCEKVGFSLERSCFIESFLFPFCKYLASKQLKHQWSPSKLIYRGSTLEISRQEHPSIYVGICKEIEFDHHDCLDELVDTFFEKVDKHLEKNMNITHKGYELIVSKFNHALFKGECKELKYFVGAATLSFLMEDFPKFVDKKMINQFSVVYNDFTLEVWQEKGKTTNEILWHGKCDAINFENRQYRYLDTLVSFFQEAVDEYSKPTKIEYKGYELEITQSDGQFEGKSDISGGWNIIASTREGIINLFKNRVHWVEREKLISTIKKFQTEIADKKNKLEDYVRKEGYISCFNSEEDVVFYVHPDYYDNDKSIPGWAIVYIR